VVNAINAQGAFRAELDPSDTSTLPLAGTGLQAVAATAVTTGGSGTNFDRTSGIVVENGGQSFTLEFNDAETVEDLLNVLNGNGAGLHAAINAAGTGIDVRSRLSGADFWIRENGGQTATQLGILLTEFNHELEIPSVAGTDFTIVVDIGNIDADPEIEYRYLDVDLTGVSTVQGVLDRINNHPGNNLGNVALQASLTANNEVQIIDTNSRPLGVRVVGASGAAEFFGLVPPGGFERIESTGTLTGGEINYTDSGSVFTTLLRLRDALISGDTAAMERAISRIDEDINRATFARAEVGAREQALEITQRNLEDEDVQLQSALSSEIDVDLVEAISNLTARQVSLQASLQALGNILQLSLLDYL
jgi:flagellar hook-associated protein 3 FlgL